MTVEAPDGLIYADATTYQVGREDLDFVGTDNLFPDPTPIELLECSGLELYVREKPAGSQETQDERPEDYEVLTGDIRQMRVNGVTISKPMDEGAEVQLPKKRKEKKNSTATGQYLLWK
jgi:hypothetical protein